jgi:hypothetical protein
MNSIGIPELAIVVVLFGAWLSVVWPAARVCRRLGFSPWVGVLAIVPLANFLLLWWLAHTRWPIDGAARRTV